VKTNDLAGNGTTTSVVAAGANLVQITRGIDKIVVALVKELKKLSKEVEDSELADVAAVSVGNNPEVGQMIAKAARRIPAIVARSNLTQ
jgi:chaperonin GroEL